MPRDATHDPAILSWVESANAGGTDFPLQNLPFGVFEQGGDARVGIAIGDRVLDLRAARDGGHFDGLDPAHAPAVGQRTLNALLALGRPALGLRATNDALTSRAAFPARSPGH